MAGIDPTGTTVVEVGSKTFEGVIQIKGAQVDRGRARDFSAFAVRI